MVALDSYGGLTEFGLFVRPELADMLDGLPQADLEERYLKHGTVVVHGKDHGLFQATKVRGSANAREIFFAPSEKSSSKSFSIRPSELYSSGDSGNISHVFMNVIGALFAPRTGEDDPPSTLLFKVVSLVAAKEAKVMETVTLRTMLGGVAIGEALSVRAAEFFLSYVPKSALDARAAALASRGAGGGGESEMMGFVDMSTEYPELFKSLQALGAGGAVQYSAAEIAAYATVALEGVVAGDREEADEAAAALERTVAAHASPEREKLKLLHRIGAVTKPRPVLGGRALRQVYFPTLPPLPQGAGAGGQAVGAAALAGGPFAEEAVELPPVPPEVQVLRPVETKEQKRARIAREAGVKQREEEEQRRIAKAHAKAAKRKRRKQRRHASGSGSSGSSSGDSSSDGSSSSESDSSSSRGPPRRKKRKKKHALPPSRLTADAKLLQCITPHGADALTAAAALFDGAALRALIELEELPDASAWSAERRPALLRRCALGIARIDKRMGSGKWREERPRRMADVFVLAEEVLAQAREGGSPRTGAGSAKARSRRARSASSDSSSSSSSSGKRKGKKAKGAGGSSLTGLSPDVAEGLNKARKFLEGAGGGSRAAGAAADAVSALPEELRDLARRALTSDRVLNKGEHRDCRKSCPAVIERMRDGLVRDVRRALEIHMASDMSGRSELPLKDAEALAQTIRRLDMSMKGAIAAVKAARGSRAPAAGSALELQDAWALLRAGLAELDRAVPVSQVANGATQVAAQLSTGAAAEGVSPRKCQEWMDKVFTSLASQAADARQDLTVRMPTLAAALTVREAWLRGEIGDERAFQQGARGASSRHSGGGGGGGRGGGGGGEGGKGGRGEGGRGGKVEGKHGEKAGDGEAKGDKRLWKNKPFVPDAAFKCLREKFPAGYCWPAVMFGCKRADKCNEKHKLPPGWDKMCKDCGISA